MNDRIHFRDHINLICMAPERLQPMIHFPMIFFKRAARLNRSQCPDFNNILLFKRISFELPLKAFCNIILARRKFSAENRLSRRRVFHRLKQSFDLYETLSGKRKNDFGNISLSYHPLQFSAQRQNCNTVSPKKNIDEKLQEIQEIRKVHWLIG